MFHSTSNSFHSNSYASKFTFKDGYNIAAVWQDGDTATSSFSLAKDNDTLFKESNIFIWNGLSQKLRRQYDLTIGDVEIKKSSGIDSIQVFVDGVLQQTCSRDHYRRFRYNGSVCHKEISC